MVTLAITSGGLYRSTLDMRPAIPLHEGIWTIKEGGEWYNILSRKIHSENDLKK